MTRLRAWLQGKKTYACAAALAVIGCAGYYSGALDGATASAVLCAAGGVAGLGAKSQRAADSILVALNNVRDAQARAAAQHKPVDVTELAAAVAKEIAPQVVSAIVPVAGVPGAAGIAMPDLSLPASRREPHVVGGGAPSRELTAKSQVPITSSQEPPVQEPPTQEAQR